MGQWNLGEMPRRTARGQLPGTLGVLVGVGACCSAAPMAGPPDLQIHFHQQHSCPMCPDVGERLDNPVTSRHGRPLAGRRSVGCPFVFSAVAFPGLCESGRKGQLPYWASPSPPSPWSQPTHPHFLLPRSCPGRLGSGGGSRSLPFECLPRLFGLVPTRLGSCSRPEIRSAVTT